MKKTKLQDILLLPDRATRQAEWLEEYGTLYGHESAAVVLRECAAAIRALSDATPTGATDHE